MKINLEDYKDHFPENVGEDIYINHCKNPNPHSGDKNMGFHLTRTDVGKVEGFCFHCNGGGIYEDKLERICLQSLLPREKNLAILQTYLMFLFGMIPNTLQPLLLARRVQQSLRRSFLKTLGNGG